MTGRRAPGTVGAWWLLTGAAVRVQRQYRANLLVGLFTGLAYQGIQIAFLGLLLHRFGAIGGWTMPELGLLIGIRLAAHACYLLSLGGIRRTDVLVRRGEFDLVLLRPVGVFTQLVTRRIGNNAIGNGLIGAVALVWFGVASGVHWTPWRLAYLLAAVVGGALVEAAIQTFLAGFAFRLTSTMAMNVFATTAMTQFGNYPLQIFGRGGVWLLATVLPIAWIAWLPASTLLGRTAQVPLPPWLVVASPLVGPLLFLAAHRFFIAMLRHYSSPNS